MKKITPGKVLLLVFSFQLLVFRFAPIKTAAYLYGGEEPTAQIVIDKRIKATDIVWQDNLTAVEKVFQNGDLVDFEIKVKNSGDKDLKNITVKDVLPSFLNLIFSPAKSENNGEISWTISELKAGKEETFRIRTEIKKDFKTESEGNFCALNKAEATAESGENDSDTASFCLSSVKKLPKAGAENLLLATAVSAVIASCGIGLRKFGRGEI